MGDKFGNIETLKDHLARKPQIQFLQPTVLICQLLQAAIQKKKPEKLNPKPFAFIGIQDGQEHAC